MKLDKKFWMNVVIAVAVYAVVMGLIQGKVLSRQMMSLIVPICVYVIMAVSLSLVVGFLGELSLGHAAFMSIGAYAGALVLIATEDKMPVFLCLPLAVVIGGGAAALLGFLIGIPVLRLKGDYLAIVTLGFGEIVKSVFNALSITGGAKGLSKIPVLTTYRNFTFVFVVMLIVILLVSHMVHSRHGRAVCAIRDNAIAAEAVGIPVSKYKVMAFVVAAFMAGMAGVLYAGNIGILKPVNFDYNTSIEILVMVVLGGMGNIKGAIVAAVILTALPELLRGAADYRMLIYAIALIVMMLFNNSSFKQNLIDKKNLHQAEKSREV
jgi:branched-chain amino acid transport system permease protein